MLTKRGYDEILSRIMETGGMTEDMEKDVSRLRAELDEREGILNRYGEKYDGEDTEYEWKERPAPNYAEQLDALQGRYDDLVKRYNRKFFSGGSAHDGDLEYSDGDTIGRGDETIQKSSQDITIDDLLTDIK